MSSFDASIDRDANRQVITSNESFKTESTWTYVTATTGAVGAHTLFTVTGNVLVQVFGIVDTDLTGAATLEVGIVGNTAAILAQTANATTLDDGEIYVDNSSATVETLPSTLILNDGTDIIQTIGSTAITAGVIDFYCLWRPLSSDGNITATTPA